MEAPQCARDSCKITRICLADDLFAEVDVCSEGGTTRLMHEEAIAR